MFQGSCLLIFASTKPALYEAPTFKSGKRGADYFATKYNQNFKNAQNWETYIQVRRANHFPHPLGTLRRKTAQKLWVLWCFSWKWQLFEKSSLRFRNNTLLITGGWFGAHLHIHKTITLVSFREESFQFLIHVCQCRLRLHSWNIFFSVGARSCLCYITHCLNQSIIICI